MSPIQTTRQTPIPPARQSGPPSATRRRIQMALVAAVLIVSVVVGGWLLLRSAPDEVDIEAAASQVQAASGTDGSDSGDIAGTWTVDTSVGAFSVTESTGAFVGFRVDEELAQLGAGEAVGRTGDVSGTVTIDGTTLVAGQIVADVTTMVSDESRRENSIGEALEATVYPTATFTLTKPVELGSDLSDGRVIQVDATGTMEIRGTTQTITVPLQVVSQGDVVVVTGSTDITFSDYGVDLPSAPIVVSLADTGTLELQLFMTSS